MICPYCKIKAKWVENKVLYGKNLGKSYMIWVCYSCDVYVGCHNNTKTPLGTMANVLLRKLRIKCHNKLDLLWNNKRQRIDVYKWIADKMKLPLEKAHISHFNKIQCKKFLKILEANAK